MRHALSKQIIACVFLSWNRKMNDIIVTEIMPGRNHTRKANHFQVSVRLKWHHSCFYHSKETQNVFPIDRVIKIFSGSSEVTISLYNILITT